MSNRGLSVTDRFPEALILIFDFCDKQGEAIRPRLKPFELDEGKTVSIIPNPLSQVIQRLRMIDTECTTLDNK